MNYARQSIIYMLFIGALYGCATSKAYDPSHKYAPEVLQKDFAAMRHILETRHPSLYWYTPKDSMDLWFDHYNSLLKDSMTELKFAWMVLSPMLEKIDCGHTSLRMSREFVKASRNVQLPSFPLYLKVWQDSMAVTGSLRKNESVFRRGTLITSINGVRNKALIERMFNYLPHDAKAVNINYIRLSSNFPYYHRNIMGLSREYTVGYIDSTLQEREIKIKPYIPEKDSTADSLRKEKGSLAKIPREHITRSKRLKQIRDFEPDSSGKYAYMLLNGFTKGNLRSFFRTSFRYMQRHEVPNLVLDLRNNGGGHISKYVLLAKYLSRQPFKAADSAYAITRQVSSRKAIVNGGIINNIWLFFITHRKADGNFHNGYLERKYYYPKRARHYNGHVYIITGGPTFSAGSMLVNTLKGQPGITVVGEETGGSAYGNSGVIIPDVVLPHTHLRFRLPLMRVVLQGQSGHRTYTGIIPDVPVPVSYEAIIHRYDKKIKVVEDMIFKK